MFFLHHEFSILSKQSERGEFIKRLSDAGRSLKQVLVVCSEFMIGAGVESLLSQEEDFNVQSTTLKRILSGEITQFQPNVVILDDSQRFSDLHRIFELLRECPDLRVLVINLQDNRVSIYDKHEILVSRYKDLTSAVNGGSELDKS